MARKFLVPISVSRVFGLLLPTQPSDAASKQYVDEIKKPFIAHRSGRFYGYTDNRWVTESDDNYGVGYYQWNESGTTAAEPVVENEHMGMYMPAGTVLRKLNWMSRSNNNTITDFEIRIYHRKPNPVTRWETGIDSDAEMTNTLLYSGNWSDFTVSVNSNDTSRIIIDFGDIEFADAGMLSIYVKPIGTLTATRYLRTNLAWEFLI